MDTGEKRDERSRRSYGERAQNVAVDGRVEQQFDNVWPSTSKASCNSWRFAAVGDINLDGQPDIVLQNQSTGERIIWLMDRTTIAGTVSLPTLPLSWTIAAAGSFTADTRANLLLENTTNGERLFWTLNPDGSIFNSVGLPTFTSGYRFAGSGDFNSDRQPDIILRNSLNGAHVIWLMNRTSISSSTGLPTLSSDWLIRN